MSLLESIHRPADLKRLSPAELKGLAAEIREVIIERVALNGGHLASNLGAVELTLALHRVFDSPRDRIIWDVGHQSYAHKIVTGRLDRFPTLRKKNGLSGFPKRSESPHDAFGTGHSSTSISAGLGMMEALRQQDRPGDVIAVIGDGAMTAGLAFEGMNQADHLRKKFIVVLNDNDLSISPNVGALSNYLHRIMTGRLYSSFKRETRHLLEQIPGIGEPMLRVAQRAEDTVKGFFAPGMLFEELGFEYVGPVDGHRIEALVETFTRVREADWPTLVHVSTKKGLGYRPAEQNPGRFHGIGPFDIETGQTAATSARPTYSRVFGETLTELARFDSRIVAVTAAMTEGTGLEKFANEFPARLYDVGIAEPHAVTFAAGMAAEGLKPVVAIYSSFLQRAYDQIVHDVCLQNLPVVFAIDRAGLVGEDGPTHHGAFDLSYLRHIPGLTVMAPRNALELARMLKTALALDGPAAIRFPRGAVPEQLDPVNPDVLEPISVGESQLLAEGPDVALVAIGPAANRAIEATRRLSEIGIRATVVDARFVKPLDEVRLAGLARKIGRIITIEENVIQGGFGSAVVEALSDLDIPGLRVRRLGLPDRFMPQGTTRELLQEAGLDEAGIVRAVEAFLRG